MIQDGDVERIARDLLRFDADEPWLEMSARDSAEDTLWLYLRLGTGYTRCALSWMAILACDGDAMALVQYVSREIDGALLPLRPVVHRKFRLQTRDPKRWRK